MMKVSQGLFVFDLINLITKCLSVRFRNPERQFSEEKLLKMGKSSRGNLIRHVPLFWQRRNAFERIYGARKTLMTGGEE